MLVAWLLLFFTSKFTVPIPAKLKLKPFDAMIVRHRIISSLHGLMATTFGAYYTYKHLDLSCGKENTKVETVMLLNTAAFLFADFIFMLVNKFLDVGNFIHHLIGIFGYSVVFYTQ